LGSSQGLPQSFILKPPEISDVNANAVIESTAFQLHEVAHEATWPTIVYPTLPHCGGRPGCFDLFPLFYR
jgi:hypothetical protein